MKPTLFEVTDQLGEVWTALHLSCGGKMYPAANQQAVPHTAWWWWCQDCGRFVRPLSPHESSIMDQAARAEFLAASKRKPRHKAR